MSERSERVISKGVVRRPGAERLTGAGSGKTAWNGLLIWKVHQ